VKESKIKTWRLLRQVLLVMQDNIEENNGTSECKKCGISPNELIEEFEEVLKGYTRK